jgi:hypothetical protein
MGWGWKRLVSREAGQPLLAWLVTDVLRMLTPG